MAKPGRNYKKYAGKLTPAQLLSATAPFGVIGDAVKELLDEVEKLHKESGEFEATKQKLKEDNEILKIQFKEISKVDWRAIAHDAMIEFFQVGTEHLKANRKGNPATAALA